MNFVTMHKSYIVIATQYYRLCRRKNIFNRTNCIHQYFLYFCVKRSYEISMVERYNFDIQL